MLSTFSSTVATIEQVAPCVLRFVFNLNEPKEITFQAGQYILIEVMHEGKKNFRQYSISSPPYEKKSIETVVDVTPMGIGSQFLLSLKVGDVFIFRAPMGIFTLKRTQLPKIFLATGTGITPLKSMGMMLAHEKFTHPHHLLWGLKTNTDIYFDHEFKQIAEKNHYFHYSYCLSREPKPAPHHIPGRIQNGLVKLTNQGVKLSEHEFYICGSGKMVDDIKNLLLNELKISATHVFHEKFTL